jgi:hypothetical protein
MGNGIGERLAFLVEIDHQFPPGGDPAMGPVNIDRIVVTGENVLESEFGVFLGHC